MADKFWVWPIEGPDAVQQIGHPFYEYRDSFGANKRHEGVDLRAWGDQQAVAVASGKIAKIHPWARGVRRGVNAYGNHVWVEHRWPSGLPYVSWYCHLDDFAGGLQVGMTVEQGQWLGPVGSTGNSSAEHLHFQVVDPRYGYTGFVWDRVIDPTVLLLAAMAPAQTGTPAVTNQVVINLLFGPIAQQVGMHGGTLLAALGWNELAVPDANRQKPFNFALLTKPKPGGVTQDVWDAVVAHLSALLGKEGS